MSKEKHTDDGDGDCFVAGFEVLLSIRGDIKRAGVTGDMHYDLCHGIPTGQGEIKGVRFAHCWVEVEGTVIDLSNGNNVVMERREYYALGRINPDEVDRYTFDEARNMVLEHMHYGPWKGEFQWVGDPQ